MFAKSAAYDRFMGRWSRLLAPRLLAFAGVKDGDRVLDVGAGTGSLGRAIEAHMPNSEVVGIDPSADFMAYAQAQAASGHARYEVGDAQALRLGDASFDHALSMLALNFVPSHAQAVREMRRVTRVGGVVSACVWDYDQGMQSLRFFWDEAVALDPAIEPRDERHMKLCRRGQLALLWTQAGLHHVDEASLTIEQAFASFDDYWDPFMQGVGPGGAYVATLPEDRRHVLKERLRARVLGVRADGAFVLTARAWCVRGEAPASDSGAVLGG
jgi:SAM-dependent methyltransferase